MRAFGFSLKRFLQRFVFRAFQLWWGSVLKVFYNMQRNGANCWRSINFTAAAGGHKFHFDRPSRGKAAVNLYARSMQQADSMLGPQCNTRAFRLNWKWIRRSLLSRPGKMSIQSYTKFVLYPSRIESHRTQMTRRYNLNIESKYIINFAAVKNSFFKYLNIVMLRSHLAHYC